MTLPNAILSNFLRSDPYLNLDELNQVFNHSLRRGGVSDPSTVETSQWVPAVDIIENASAFVLHTDLPGVHKDNIEVSMEEGILTIKGRRETVANEDANTVHRTERRYGEFYRKFTLPEMVDSSNIQAAFKDGVLALTIPKAEKAQPKLIEVRGD